MSKAIKRHRSVWIFYHFLHPDDIVSSVHLSGLCKDFAERGWDVTGIACNRVSTDERAALSKEHVWHGVHFRRIWRPPCPQNKGWGRVINSVWMITAWSLLPFMVRKGPDALIIGTDPVLSVLCAIPWRSRFPNLMIAHWCYDLYPEAAIADGMASENSILVKVLKALVGYAYRKCTVVVDIGPCMRQRLMEYVYNNRQHTLTPWALEEPSTPVALDTQERKSIFGTPTLALFYSGSFGKAHTCEDVLSLMHELRGDGVKLAFTARGKRFEEVRQRAAELGDTVVFVDHVPQQRLIARLGSADIHVVSLKKDWVGTVVPSKFFGALAVGRPVLFAGPDDSAVARWIREYEVGWVLNKNNLPEVAREMRELAVNRQLLEPLFERCHAVYQQHFSRRQNVQNWHQLLLKHCQGDRLTSYLDLEITS